MALRKKKNYSHPNFQGNFVCDGYYADEDGDGEENLKTSYQLQPINEPLIFADKRFSLVETVTNEKIYQEDSTATYAILSDDDGNFYVVKVRGDQTYPYCEELKTPHGWFKPDLHSCRVFIDSLKSAKKEPKPKKEKKSKINKEEDSSDSRFRKSKKFTNLTGTIIQDKSTGLTYTIQLENNLNQWAKNNGLSYRQVYYSVRSGEGKFLVLPPATEK